MLYHHIQYTIILNDEVIANRFKHIESKDNHGASAIVAEWHKFDGEREVQVIVEFLAVYDRNDECITDNPYYFVNEPPMIMKGGSYSWKLVQFNKTEKDAVCCGYIRMYAEPHFVPTSIIHLITLFIPDNNILSNMKQDDRNSYQKVVSDMVIIDGFRYRLETTWYRDEWGHDLSAVLRLMSLSPKLSKININCALRIKELKDKEVNNYISFGNVTDKGSDNAAKIEYKEINLFNGGKLNKAELEKLDNITFELDITTLCVEEENGVPISDWRKYESVNAIDRSPMYDSYEWVIRDEEMKEIKSAPKSHGFLSILFTLFGFKCCLQLFPQVPVCEIFSML